MARAQYKPEQQSISSLHDLKYRVQSSSASLLDVESDGSGVGYTCSGEFTRSEHEMKTAKQSEGF